MGTTPNLKKLCTVSVAALLLFISFLFISPLENILRHWRAKKGQYNNMQKTFTH